MKYRAKEIDGEWLVVDENEDIVADAADRRDAITMANAMTRESSNADSKPNIHRGSSYGNKPEAELDESTEEKSYTMIVGKSGNSGMTDNNPNQYTKKRTVKFTASDWDSAKEKINSLLKPGEYLLYLYDDSSIEFENNQVSEGVSDYIGSNPKKTIRIKTDRMFSKADRVESALGYMKDLIAQGVEFPEAEFKAITKHKLNAEEADEMVDLYDNIDESLEEATKQGADEHAANELVLYAESDSDLYKQSALPIVANLQRKVKKGNYDPELAIKLWRYHADRAAKKYFKEFPDGNDFTFSPATRDLAAKEFRDNYEEHVMEAKPQDVKEENLQELSKGTLKSYVKKATSSSHENSASNLSARGAYKLAKFDTSNYYSGEGGDDGKFDDEKSFRRSDFVSKAIDKLTEAAPRITPDEAKSILGELEYSGDSKDFFTLRNSEVSKLLDHAKRLKYRKSKYAPGSTARMFYQYLTRLANKSGSSENIQEAYDKLTDKQLQDKFVSLKVKSKDLSKDSKDSKELQKIRDEIAKRKNLKKESVENIQEAYDKLTDKQLQDKFVSLKVKSKDLSKDSKDSKELQKIRDEIAKRKNLKKESVESQDVMIAESIINILFGNIK